MNARKLQDFVSAVQSTQFTASPDMRGEALQTVSDIGQALREMVRLGDLKADPKVMPLLATMIAGPFRGNPELCMMLCLCFAQLVDSSFRAQVASVLATEVERQNLNPEMKVN